MTQGYIKNIMMHNYGIDEQNAENFINNKYMTDEMKESFVGTYNFNAIRLQQLAEEKEKLESLVRKHQTRDLYGAIYSMESSMAQIETEQDLIYHAFTHNGEMAATLSDRNGDSIAVTMTPQDSIWSTGAVPLTNGTGGWDVEVTQIHGSSGPTHFAEGNITREDVGSVDDLVEKMTKTAQSNARYTLSYSNESELRFNAQTAEEHEWSLMFLAPVISAEMDDIQKPSEEFDKLMEDIQQMEKDYGWQERQKEYLKDADKKFESEQETWIEQEADEAKVKNGHWNISSEIQIGEISGMGHKDISPETIIQADEGKNLVSMKSGIEKRIAGIAADIKNTESELETVRAELESMIQSGNLETISDAAYEHDINFSEPLPDELEKYFFLKMMQ